MENTTRKDILKKESLRKIPFSVPAGYFETMNEKVDSTIRKEIAKHRRKTKISIVLLASAACLATIIATTTLLLDRAGENGSSNYYAADATGTMSQEEIVEYLIESGVSLEELGY